MIERQVMFAYDIGVRSIALAVVDVETKQIIDIEVIVVLPDKHSNSAKRGNYRRTRRQNNRKFRLRKRLNNLILKNICDFFNPKAASEKINIYREKLRKKALDEKISGEEIASIIYLLTKQRGIHSPRKSEEKSKKDEKEKKQNKAKEELRIKFEESGARTIGEYLVDMFDEEKMCCGELSIRNKGDMEIEHGIYISREMVVDEVHKILKKQAQYHIGLTPKVIKKIEKDLFFQRGPKSQRDKRSKCQFENGKVSVKYSLVFADFKLLQFLRNTRILDKENYEARDLTELEFDLLYENLTLRGELTYAKARKVIGIPRGFIFNWEEEDKFKNRKMESNRVVSDIANAVGEKRWLGMTEKEQATIVADLKSSMSDEHLRRRFTKQNFNEEEIEKLIEVPVETGCGNLSANAMRKLIPFMREGESYPSAVMLVYPTNKFGYAFPLLPPRSFLGPCWNPEVEKICSIAGRMTNSAIAKHGNPVGAIVEMTREAGHSEKVRKKIHMENVRRAIARGKIKEEIIAKTEIRYPSRKDVDKVLLAKECRWINIYNGEKMTYESIFSNQEDEHIISRNESMDNSLSNRTLCPKNMNAVKGNKTPFEAFGHDKENFKKMKERVKNLVDPYSEPTRNKKTGKLEYQKSPYLSGKKKKFAKESFSKHELKEFTNRALTNTSHACCEARRYLAMLFAGDISRIKTVSGSVVSILRRNWIDKDFTMKDEINPGPGKNRDDHRHHGIDAAVIACADRKVIKKVESQIRRGVPYGKIKVDLPYEEFEKDVQQIIDPLIVRQVAKTKSNFRLHEETLLRMKQGPSTQGEVAPSKRMSIFSMTDAMVDKIKDPEIKKIVKEFRSEGDLKKKAREQIFPYLVDKKGRKRYIKRVQVYEKRNPVKIGAEGKERYVLTGGNRHAEIFLSDLKPYIKVITNLEAATRVRNKERISDALADLVLFIGSTVEMKMKISSKEFGERRVFVVKKITGGKELPKITFALHNDARPVKPAKINAGKTEDDFRKDYTLSLNDLIKAEPVLYYSAIREEVCV